jgi:hypothetical protein
MNEATLNDMTQCAERLERKQRRHKRLGRVFVILTAAFFSGCASSVWVRLRPGQLCLPTGGASPTRLTTPSHE